MTLFLLSSEVARLFHLANYKRKEDMRRLLHAGRVSAAKNGGVWGLLCLLFVGHVVYAATMPAGNVPFGKYIKMSENSYVAANALTYECQTGDSYCGDNTTWDKSNNICTAPAPSSFCGDGAIWSSSASVCLGCTGTWIGGYCWSNTICTVYDYKNNGVACEDGYHIPTNAELYNMHTNVGCNNHIACYTFTSSDWGYTGTFVSDTTIRSVYSDAGWHLIPVVRAIWDCSSGTVDGYRLSVSASSSACGQSCFSPDTAHSVYIRCVMDYD